MIHIYTKKKTPPPPPPPAEFDLQWPQTHDLDRAVTDIGQYYTFNLRKFTKRKVTTLFSSQDSTIPTKQQ